MVVAFALLHVACHETPTMSFGLSFLIRGSDLPPTETAQSSCTPPGASHGSISASSIDDWEIGEPPPHLFLELDPDAEENVYRIRVFSALEHDEDGFWWVPSEILAERSYDGAFGESGAQDAFVVDFEEQQYTVDVQGLPPDAACP
jgi:hypothetical protein